MLGIQLIRHTNSSDVRKHYIYPLICFVLTLYSLKTVVEDYSLILENFRRRLTVDDYRAYTHNFVIGLIVIYQVMGNLIDIEHLQP